MANGFFLSSNDRLMRDGPGQGGAPVGTEVTVRMLDLTAAERAAGLSGTYGPEVRAYLQSVLEPLVVSRPTGSDALAGGLTDPVGIPFTSLPPAANAPGAVFTISSFPTRPQYWSDGTKWRPLGGLQCVLLDNGPTILLSSATNITATGAITGLTALSYTPAGVVRVYCFAQAGLVAGLYFATFSSATACQLWTNAAGTITPTGITPGALVGGTGVATLFQTTLPANTIPFFGGMDARADFNRPATANSILTYMGYGGDIASTGNITAPSTAGGRFELRIRNRGTFNNSIRMHPAGGNPGFSGAPVLVLSSLTNPQSLTVQAQLSAATDWLILETLTVDIRG